MKKRLFVVFVILSFLLLVCSNSFASNIWAMKKPVAAAPFSWLDHTYACVDSSSNCYTCPAGASKTGGSWVNGGTGNGSEAVCYAYCTLNYGADGVCHQHTNRVLFPTLKTLTTVVVGYSYSVSIWGLYGVNTWASCIVNCD